MTISTVVCPVTCLATSYNTLLHLQWKHGLQASFYQCHICMHTRLIYLNTLLEVHVWVQGRSVARDGPDACVGVHQMGCTRYMCRHARFLEYPCISQVGVSTSPLGSPWIQPWYMFHHWVATACMKWWGCRVHSNWFALVLGLLCISTEISKNRRTTIIIVY